MIAQTLKRAAALLPSSWQHELRRLHFRNQISRRSFATDEKEYDLLPTLLRPGDWALDIGANVGHYTMRMSELVGATGRVIAMEPVPDTFAILAANVQLCRYPNVSVINVAASDRTSTAGVRIPNFSGGLKNYYQAALVSDATDLCVLTLSVDALALPSTVRLVKIDVEGHELPVLRGMRQLIERDHPTLIVETYSQQSIELLADLRYVSERLPESSNLVCRPIDQVSS